MRLLVLVTDAFGGRGGIAKFNRDLLTALCAHPAVTEVVALPRIVTEDVGALPEKLAFRAGAAGDKSAFVRAVGQAVLRDGAFDGVVCGHMNLLPLGALAAARHRVPLLQIVHGIEAWAPKESVAARAVQRLSARTISAVVAVSDVTRQRLGAWLPLGEAQSFVVPNCIDAAAFGPGPKRADLLARYGLEGRRVLLTLGRLDAAERYKGFDEVMEALPDLAAEMPDLAYLICGDGDDRSRLEQKASALGVADRVVFAGYVPEAEKADHYRLADAFVMPGRGEGFGIVYLEALACGVPVVASALDASREAVRDGALGAVVNPDDPASVKAGIRAVLRDASAAERRVPEGLAYFSFERFQERWHRVLDRVFTSPSVADARPAAPLSA